MRLHPQGRQAAGCVFGALLLALAGGPAAAAEATWTGIATINPASDMVDDSGPECRDGRLRVELTVDDGAVSGRLVPLGNPGAPGFDRGPIPLSGEVDSTTGTLAVHSGGTDYHYNRLTGTLASGTWRNAECWGEYRLQRGS